MTTTSATLAHLFRRAGFGATGDQIQAATRAGYTATVQTLLSGVGGADPGADAVPTPSLTVPAPEFLARLKAAATKKAAEAQLATERRQLVDWWLARMAASTNPLQEKLTLLLHGHFPTAVSKVRFPLYMYNQNQLFRTRGGGDFGALTLAVARDPAMMIWLDLRSDTAGSPNENFARELMERFTMGIGTYGEADVRAGAVAFTGSHFDPATGQFSVLARAHDPTPQTFLGVPGVSTGEQVVAIAVGSAASSRFVPKAFWSHLAYPVDPRDKVVTDLAASYQGGRSVTGLLQAIFEHPAFTSATAKAGLVKQPAEYVVGALRALGLTRPEDVKALKVQGTMAKLGQVLFDPPSVGGWPQNAYWLSTAAALARWEFARAAVARADISAVADAPKRSRVEAVAHLLGIPSWSKASAAALARAAGDPSTLIVLALVAPEYVTN